MSRKYTTQSQTFPLSIKKQAVKHALQYTTELQVILAEIAERLINGEIDPTIPKFTQRQVLKVLPVDYGSISNVSMLLSRFGRKSRNKKGGSNE